MIADCGGNFNRGYSPILLEYIQAALRHALYEILPDDGSYYGEIPDCIGVYASAGTLEDCREQLREVLDEWVLFRVHKNLSLPAVDGIELPTKILRQAGVNRDEWDKL